jgi:hypothetical protein
MNEAEHLLVVVTEEASEAAFTACKALRFGLDHVWPGENETNRRILERELAQLLATAELCGLQIRNEDKIAKVEKLKKFMEYAKRIGTIEFTAATPVRGICRGCKQPVPDGFLSCSGNGSHQAI